MSRQIQIRRGSASDHANFTGAIGEITMDTTNKTLRVHDGTTAGGTILAKKSEIPTVPNFPNTMDYVVESQLPTASNNYKWYRKYKSGWVEQGGVFSSVYDYYNTETVSLPVTMADTNYCGYVTSFAIGSAYTPRFVSKGTTSVEFDHVVNIESNGGCWMICGMAATN